MFSHSLHFNPPTCKKPPNTLLAQAPLRLIFSERKSWEMLWQKITHGRQSPFMHLLNMNLTNCILTLLIPSDSIIPWTNSFQKFTIYCVEKYFILYFIFFNHLFLLVLVAGLTPSTIWWLTILCLCHHASPRHLTSLSVITQASSPRPTLNCS